MTAAVILSAVLVAVAASPKRAPQSPADETAASGAAVEVLAALDDFMAAFNASDMKRWSETLNYPHVRLAGGDVRVWQSASEYQQSFDFEAFRRQSGWHHSEWDDRRIVQAGKDKARHVAVAFTRYRADGTKIATYEALYIVTNRSGHWGVQARLSFAP